MADQPKNYSFSTFFSKGQYETQVEMLEVGGKSKNLSIGIPKENLKDEHRVMLVPSSITTLTGYGHRILVETGAGDDCNFTDHNFSEVGAEIASDKKQVYECDIIVKASPPTLEELDLYHENQILISPLHIPKVSSEFLLKLKQKRIIAIALEYLQSEDGSFPVVRIMGEIAGRSAMLTAGELLANTNNGRGVLLGGVTGVPPAKVVILGAGIVGESATRIARGLGASVRVFDNDISKLMRLQSNIGSQLHTSSLNPVYLSYQLTSADILIGAIHSKVGRTPIIVTEEMVSKMKSGSVIIDVSIDQGGCIETSRITSHSKPTFTKHDVIHYCVPNIPSKVARTASIAVSNILTPLILQVANSHNTDHLLINHFGIRNGVYTYKGCLTNEYLANRFEINYTALDLLLSSNL